ncbi:START domain-containing protein [Vibrio sp. ZSDZ65]|uniref:START domain-containing protein n=1 Tax=Vibrio qingdaonensis TaxID=2829491 RepID=A0A9X3CPB2_9VIBR|nr:START domain-containing protein [Vibrio qingdaonensis]MCW8346921.1 START domain-containing protein [Vibrio qingdaonensis]
MHRYIRQPLMRAALVALAMLPISGLSETTSDSAQVVRKPWLVSYNQDAITLYKREHKDGLVEIRVHADVETTFSGFLLLFEDTEHVPTWLHNVDQTKVLSQLSVNENIVYTTFAAPWPALDRDMVTYSRYYQQGKRFVLEIRDASEYLAKQAGFIRITQVKSRWELTKLGDGQVFIMYTAFADPGGALPDWLVNQLAIDGAIETFKGLKREIRHYQHLSHPNIVD